jgi:NitT/TauT family transport system permease protein
MKTSDPALIAPVPLQRARSRPALSAWARSFAENLFPFIVLAVIWETTVRLNVFPRVLMPSLVDIGATAWRMSLDGTLFHHLGASVIRLLVGFIVGAAAGIGLGMLMGQSQRAEKFFLPLLSALMPIPSLAWIPLFILWFGLGDAATMAVIIFSVVLPVAFNAWTGVKSANPVWVRAAESMGCHGRKLFFSVVLPGSLSMIFTGLRIGLSQGWRALVAGEMLSSPEWGMGFAIFDSRQFLATDVMLVMVMCIGLTGFLIVTVLFGYVERRTVVRWGMLQEVGA